MSQDEEKILNDLVTQSLASKGFLGKIKAEIRAGVFVALEEQEVLKDVNINKPLKDFIETTNGALVISLVREFLEFFNLQFTNMVFDPETHAGVDYKFEGRKKLANDLNINSDQDTNLPLLGLLLQSLQNHGQSNGTSLNSSSPTEANKKNSKINSSEHLENGNCHEDNQVNQNGTEGDEDIEEIIDHDKKNNSFGQLKDESFPDIGDISLNPKSPVSDSSSLKIGMNELNELLSFEPDGGDDNYEEDFVSSGSDKKDKTESTESEIDEELPTHSNHSNGDDNTADLTVSKESGQGDYTEKLSNSLSKLQTSEKES